MRLEDPALIETNKQIDWLLSSSNVSTWLNNALTAARARDPVKLLNNLGILDQVLTSVQRTGSFRGGKIRAGP